jgi:cell division protein FtsI (penicillin-binding protein 3)
LAKPEIPGHDLHLTIDKAIQEIAEAALYKGVKNAKAKSGFVVVSDPHSGKLLAVANYPTFDPNSDKINLSSRNKAFQDLFEPGSVVKPLVMAKALEAGKVTLDQRFYCEKGYLREEGVRLRDSHAAEFLTAEEALVHSSNICTYKIAKLMGEKSLYQGFIQWGISSDDNLIGLPGQSVGRIAPYQSWRKIRFANIAIGQGMMVSALEMVGAYGALANGGRLMKPYLVERIETAGGENVMTAHPKILRQVTTPEIAKKIRAALAKVVTEGKGSNAKLEGYTSGGKTGTSEKVDPRTKAYADDLRIASFIGLAPAFDPHLVIYAVIDEPGLKPYYGSTWAAPVFREVAEKSLRYLNVKEDKIDPKLASAPDKKKEL